MYIYVCVCVQMYMRLRVNIYAFKTIIHNIYIHAYTYGLGYTGQQGIGRYSKPRYLMFGFKDLVIGKMDAYGEILKENEIRGPEFYLKFQDTNIHQSDAYNNNNNNNNNDDGAVVGMDNIHSNQDQIEMDIMDKPNKVITEDVFLNVYCEQFFMNLGVRSHFEFI